MSSLEIDPDAVNAAGSLVAAGGSSVQPPMCEVSPAAADPVSMAVAQGFSARIAAIAAHSTAAGRLAAAWGTVLCADAAAYQDQDMINAAALRSPRTTAGAVTDPPSPLQVTVGAPPAPAFETAAPPSAARIISELIHTGPGAGSLYAAAGRLRKHAEQLTAIESQIRSAAGELVQNWKSDAGSAAAARIVELADWLADHTDRVAATADAVEAQGDTFALARAAIPHPGVFDDLDRRIRNAYGANAVTRGAYNPVLADLYHQQAAVNAQASIGYGHYTGAAAAHQSAEPLIPPPHTAVAAPSGSEQAGTRAHGEPATGTDPAATTALDPGVDPLPDGRLPPSLAQAGELVQEGVGAVAGAVAGSVGGLVGALGGGLNRALAGMSQAGERVLGNLAQGLSPEAPTTRAPSGAAGSPPGEPALAGGLDGGGDVPTEPSSGADTGPLTAPTGAADALAAAAKPAAPMSADPPVPAAGGGGDGGYLPPLSGGARPGGVEPDRDLRLKPERRLKVDPPPNSEPVKGRREPRLPGGDRPADS